MPNIHLLDCADDNRQTVNCKSFDHYIFILTVMLNSHVSHMRYGLFPFNGITINESVDHSRCASIQCITDYPLHRKMRPNGLCMWD